MSRSRGALAALAALIAATGLSACGSFDSKASGERLIRDYVKKYGRGTITLTSVGCPSGVAQRVGGSYDCKVSLRNSSSGATGSGTITIHMVAGNKVEITGPQDIRVQ